MSARLAMKLSMGLCSNGGTLTPTLSRKREREHCPDSRKREREHCPLSPGAGGEGWGEGALARKRKRE